MGLPLVRQVVELRQLDNERIIIVLKNGFAFNRAAKLVSDARTFVSAFRL
jgi:hypothetical protein